MKPSQGTAGHCSPALQKVSAPLPLSVTTAGVVLPEFSVDLLIYRSPFFAEAFTKYFLIIPRKIMRRNYFPTAVCCTGRYEIDLLGLTQTTRTWLNHSTEFLP